MTDSTDAVLIERHDPGVLVVTFNRPETMNAFSSEMSAAFTTALRHADTDDSIRVVVVTGSGRAFCAGADFSKGSGAFATPTKETFSSDPLDPFHPWECRKPVIAAINGHAVGIGMTMTLQCDLESLPRSETRHRAEPAGCCPTPTRTGPSPVSSATAGRRTLVDRPDVPGHRRRRMGTRHRSPARRRGTPRAMALATEIATQTAPCRSGSRSDCSGCPPSPTRSTTSNETFTST